MRRSTAPSPRVRPRKSTTEAYATVEGLPTRPETISSIFRLLHPCFHIDQIIRGHRHEKTDRMAGRRRQLLLGVMCTTRWPLSLPRHLALCGSKLAISGTAQNEK